jgi:histidinol dehydrogenase
MPALKLRRIDLTASNAAAQIVKLRDQFRIDAEVVSPASKKLTQAVFGEALSPAQAVSRICHDVENKGLSAVLSYTEQLDKVKLKPDMVRVKPAELADGHAKASPDFLEAIRQVQYNVLQFQSGLMHRDAEMRVSGMHELHVRYRPLDRVGVYCPGGAAAYPSTLLMTVCPAQAAGSSRSSSACRPRTPVRTTQTCWPSATSWASRRCTGSAAPRRSRRWPTGWTASSRWT